MGEIDQIDDAIHHGVAQRNQGVHTAQHQSIDDLLYKGVHEKLLRFLGAAEFNDCLKRGPIT